MSEANREQAERAAERGLAARAAGNMPDAVKWLEKSLRLYDDARVRAVLQQLRAPPAAAPADEDPTTPPPHASSASRHATAGSTGSSSGGGAHARHAHHHASSSHSEPPGKTHAPAHDAGTRAASARPFTAEQAEMVAKIKRAKDYYDVLGLSRTADGDEVKRAYKRVAFKLHPDKNSAPGSEEAFKRVGAAYTVLSDADKRAAYDRYGEDHPAAGGSGYSTRSGVDPRQAYYAQYENDISPEDIFNMFFGGGMPRGGGVYTFSTGGFPARRATPRRTAAGSGRAADAEPDADTIFGQKIMQLIQFLPILIVLLFSLFSFRGVSPSNVNGMFKLSRDYEFTVERKTVLPDFTLNLPYFVKPSFSSTVGRDAAMLRRVEQAVEEQLFQSLERGCTEERIAKRRLEVDISRERDAAHRQELQRRAAALPQEQCNLFKKYFSPHAKHL